MRNGAPECRLNSLVSVLRQAQALYSQYSDLLQPDVDCSSWGAVLVQKPGATAVSEGGLSKEGMLIGVDTYCDRKRMPPVNTRRRIYSD